MHTSPLILDEQLNLLDRQAGQDRANNGHSAIVLGCEMDDLIALALETLDRIKRRTASLPSDELIRYFNRWHDIAIRMLDSVEHMEKEGYQPDRSADFRFAINEASIAVHADGVAAARRRLDQGHARDLDEIINGIRPQT